MRMSKLVGERIKEVPSGANLKSHILMLRAGYIKQVSAGIFSLLPPAQRVNRKIQNIIREELDAIGGQEVQFPVVMPREIWDMSGRYDSIGDELLRFKDRTGRDMVLGMTHEEAAVHMMLNTVKSHEQLPVMIYQIQTKYRDEPRPRGGLLRVKEFTMSDGYSFHLSQEDLENYYKKAYDAHVRIFKRIGFKHFISVKSDSGAMGGKVADEFQALTDAGEDKLAVCHNCGYASNVEVAVSVKDENDHRILGEKEEVFTGLAQTIDEVCAFLEIDAKHTCKAVCHKTSDGRLVLTFLRGDCEVNEIKLANLLACTILPTDAAEFGLISGNIGCLNLNLPQNAIVLFDKTLDGLENFVTGANKKEFHLKNVSASRDLAGVEFVDVSLVQEGDKCANCGHELSLTRGTEIGNIFQLGTKYTHSMGMKVTMPDGSVKEPVMGCYGIGVGRAMASIIEEQADEKGLVFPMTIAPYHVHLCALRLDNENVHAVAEELYKNMQKAGIEVLFDDRNLSAGLKLTDSELMGVPIRVVISPKTIASAQAEVTMRATGEQLFINMSDLIPELKALIQDEIDEINSTL